MSVLVDIDVAMLHCKADSNEEAMVQTYLNAAEAAVQRFANRNIYVDQDALDTARDAVPAAMVTANADYAAAMTAAGALGTPEDIADAEAAAAQTLRATKVALSYANDGMVVTDDVIAAVLLMTGHLYRNREEVQTGPGANAVVLPMGAQALMATYRILGLQ